MDQIVIQTEESFEVLPLTTAEKMADTFKGLADSTRIRLLFILLQGETCVNTLSERVGMSQSAVSHQLRILRDLGFVSTRREGQSIYYRVDDEHIGDLYQRTLEHTKHK
jgi:DNA-binding transcriptional ArsR family regulator